MTPIPQSGRIVCLIDVDNTLLDNDAIIADLKAHLAQEAPELQAHYWRVFEERRTELGYADYLGTLERCRLDDPRDQRLLRISAFLIDYPFTKRLYPGALELVAQLGADNQTVILSDGDVVFQPLKIARSGLAAAVSGRVLVYVHKDQQLDDIARRFPADHYVLVDDKVRILTAFKQAWGDRVTTVFPRQGHYAHDPAVAEYPRPDVAVEHIADLIDHSVWQSAALRRNRT